MNITITELLLWIIISFIVGLLGELVARRRTPDGIIGATILGFIAIFVIIGLLGERLTRDIFVAGVPIFSAILWAAILTVLWSGFAYRHYRHGYERYYRRGTYVRRPRRRGLI